VSSTLEATHGQIDGFLSQLPYEPTVVSALLEKKVVDHFKFWSSTLHANPHTLNTTPSDLNV
jgi:hypothetical protein